MNESRILVPVEWTLRAISLVAIVYSLYLLLQHQFLVYSFGYISSVSLGSVGALFILSEYSFSKRGGMTKINSIIFRILFPAAFLSTYEIIYHFSFPLDLTSNELFQIGNGARYLATGGVLILPLFLLRNELTFRRISRVLLIIFVAMWIVWFFYGFPQYYIAGNGLVYSSPILKTNDPWDTSLFYNFGSKAVLAALFASILKIPYWKEFENLIISGLRSSFARKQTRK